jgi:hypothetical protein
MRTTHSAAATEQPPAPLLCLLFLLLFTQIIGEKLYTLQAAALFKGGGIG